MKHPYIPFYGGDWKKDTTVKCLSLAARGLWFEMLLSMHEIEPRGFLQHSGGEPLSDDEIARLVGCDGREVKALIKEMERAGTFSRNPQGVIYCRRMATERQISETRRKVGASGNDAKRSQTSRKSFAKASQNKSVCDDFAPINDDAKRSQIPDSDIDNERTKKTSSPAPDDFADALYARHPKKRNKALVEQIVGELSLREDWQTLSERIDSAHWEWCKTENWRKEDGRFSPKLDEWLADEGYASLPASARSSKSSTPWVDPCGDPNA